MKKPFSNREKGILFSWLLATVCLAGLLTWLVVTPKVYSGSQIKFSISWIHEVVINGTDIAIDSSSANPYKIAIGGLVYESIDNPMDEPKGSYQPGVVVAAKIYDDMEVKVLEGASSRVTVDMAGSGTDTLVTKSLQSPFQWLYGFLVVGGTLGVSAFVLALVILPSFSAKPRRARSS